MALTALGTSGYTATVGAPKAGQVQLGTLDLQPAEHRVLDDLVLQAPGSIDLAAFDGGGQLLGDGRAQVYTGDGESMALVDILRGRATLTMLQPGRYYVEVWPNRPTSRLLLWGECEVASAATVQLEIRGRSAVQANVQFRDPADPERFVALRACWRDADGNCFGWSQTFAQNRPPMRVGHFVPEGRYRLDCRGPDGLQFTADIDVKAEAGSDWTRPITVDLPQH